MQAAILWIALRMALPFSLAQAFGAMKEAEPVAPLHQFLYVLL